MNSDGTMTDLGLDPAATEGAQGVAWVEHPSRAIQTSRAGAVALIRLNRPESRNAIDRTLADALLSEVDTLDADPSVRAVVLTGAGRGFSSGMDLAEYSRVGVPNSLNEFYRRGSSKPLIAAVEGFAVAGGLEIAIRCDLIVAGESARFALPESKVGLIAWYAAGRLQQLLPATMVAEMLFTGDPLPARRAHQLGLVSSISEDGKALEASIALATRIAANAPLSVQAGKSLVDLGFGLTSAEYAQEMGAVAAEVYDSDDSRIGAQAFLNKVAPRWTGE